MVLFKLTPTSPIKYLSQVKARITPKILSKSPPVVRHPNSKKKRKGGAKTGKQRYFASKVAKTATPYQRNPGTTNGFATGADFIPLEDPNRKSKSKSKSKKGGKRNNRSNTRKNRN